MSPVPFLRSALAVSSCLLVAALLPSSLGGADGALPPTLRMTGLYSDWAHKTVSPAVVPYTPQYPLWSDGATKQRWIRLPKGGSIDASNADEWRFPVGTRLWKEFRFGDHRVETRYIERTANGWRYAAYAWNPDESEARLAPDGGIARAVEIGDGRYHAIPSRVDCRACHEGRTVPVLGFTALQLSPDRDPGAPGALPPRTGDADLRTLAARGLIRGLSPTLLEKPPRIRARSATERAALGYLYANCAVCHNADGPLASLGLSLDVRLGTAPDAESDALRTTVHVPSRYPLAGEPAGSGSERVVPGAPDRSVLAARMAARGSAAQMPPLGTTLVDASAVALVRRWIAEDLGRDAVVQQPSRPPRQTEEKTR